MSSYEFFQKTNVFVHFLEEIEDTKKTFRNYLTFRKMEKGRTFTTNEKKWSNYLQLKSYVNNTPVKTAIYSIDLQHSTRLSPLGSGEQLNSETCRMLELLESDMTQGSKS